MSSRYKTVEATIVHFVTCTVVGWVETKQELIVSN